MDGKQTEFHVGRRNLTRSTILGGLTSAFYIRYLSRGSGVNSYAETPSGQHFTYDLWWVKHWNSTLEDFTKTSWSGPSVSNLEYRMAET